jgi:hypothetical protein
MRNRNSLIQQIQRQRNVNFANKDRVANRNLNRVVSVGPQLRGKFSDSQRDAMQMVSVARRLMSAYNALVANTQYSTIDINREMQMSPYKIYDIDDNLTHLYNTNNHQELVAAFQRNVQRCKDLAHQIGSLMDQIDHWVQAHATQHFTMSNVEFFARQRGPVQRVRT